MTSEHESKLFGRWQQHAAAYCHNLVQVVTTASTHTQRTNCVLSGPRSSIMCVKDKRSVVTDNLCSTDESDGAEPSAACVKCLMSGLDDLRMTL